MSTIIVSDWPSFITAVGTVGADVEFPKNLVKTADVDVNPDKLYVDSNGVVQSNVQPSDLANLYENTFELNADDVAEEGFTSSININCLSLNGFGGTIRNIYNTTCNMFVINNANFTMSNMAILDSNLKDDFMHASDTLNDTSGCTKCIFSAMLVGDNDPIYFINDYHMFFRQCSFNLRLRSKALFLEPTYPYFNKLEYCRVEIDADNTGVNILPGINSYFTGTFPTQVHATMPSNYTNVYCIYDIYCPSILAGTWTVPVSTCICNIDKCEGAHQYLLEATTDEWKGAIGPLTDAAYLSSIGFPIET